jgi:hypothetical protein
MQDICGTVVDMTQRLALRSGEVQYAVQLRQEFTCNDSLRGHISGDGWGSGRLPAQHIEAFKRASEAIDFYVVKSYGTPIAWFANGVWTVPNVKYSPTTSNHQRVVREGINNA